MRGQKEVQQMEKAMSDWKESIHEVTELAEWLSDECCMFEESRAMLRMIRNPHKWESERKLYEIYCDLPSYAGDARERVVVAAMEFQTLDDELQAEIDSLTEAQSGSEVSSFFDKAVRLVLGKESS